jgi:hypothetical protein
MYTLKQMGLFHTLGSRIHADERSQSTEIKNIEGKILQRMTTISEFLVEVSQVRLSILSARHIAHEFPRARKCPATFACYLSYPGVQLHSESYAQYADVHTRPTEGEGSEDAQDVLRAHDGTHKICMGGVPGDRRTWTALCISLLILSFPTSDSTDSHSMGVTGPGRPSQEPGCGREAVA